MCQITSSARSARHQAPLFRAALCLGVLWLGPGSTAGVFGQGTRWSSHGPIPGDSHLKPTALADRLKLAQESSQAQQLLQKSLTDPKFLQQILKDLNEHNQGELKDLIKSLDENRIKLDPRHPFMKQLEEIFKKPGALPPDFARNYPKLEEDLKALLPRTSSGSASGSGPAANPDISPPRTSDSPQPGGPSANPASETMIGPSRLPRDLEDPLRQSRVGEWMLKQLNESPELRDTVEGLLRFHPRAGAGGGGNTWGDKVVQRINRYLPEPSFWTNKVLPKLPQVSLPALPKVHLPDVHINPPSLPSVHLPRVSLPSPPNGRAGYGWLVLPVCLILGLIGWKIFQGQRQPRGPGFGRFGSGERWALGPWPVDPAAISSEAELIRAFEYLTLLKLGPDARSWNHHAIALELGGDQPDRRRAADQLAALYERSRYAPVHEPLAGEILHSARHALTYLAEGTAP